MDLPYCRAKIAEKVSVYTFSDTTAQIPVRCGFALRDAMEASLRHAALTWGRRSIGSRITMIGLSWWPTSSRMIVFPRRRAEYSS